MEFGLISNNLTSEDYEHFNAQYEHLAPIRSRDILYLLRQLLFARAKKCGHITQQPEVMER